MPLREPRLRRLAAFGAFTLLTNSAHPDKPRLDVPGTITASAGLFGLVYGFSHAAETSWSNTTTIVSLVAGAVLLTAFVAIQRRVAHPLLPLRVVLDRDRGGSYLAVGLSGIAIFGVFLFLTYYLQQNLGFSPIASGAAFLPMTFAIMLTATTSQTKLLPRIGARPLVGAGLVLGMVGMLYLTGIGTDSSYWTHVFPALLIMGAGFGLIFAPAIATATLGVEPGDAGVASAMVNTMQQIGGSIGTALLSTLAASATTSALAGKQPTPDLLAQAAVTATRPRSTGRPRSSRWPPWSAPRCCAAGCTSRRRSGSRCWRTEHHWAGQAAVCPASWRLVRTTRRDHHVDVIEDRVDLQPAAQAFDVACKRPESHVVLALDPRDVGLGHPQHLREIALERAASIAKPVKALDELAPAALDSNAFLELRILTCRLRANVLPALTPSHQINPSRSISTRYAS